MKDDLRIDKFKRFKALVLLSVVGFGFTRVSEILGVQDLFTDKDSKAFNPNLIEASDEYADQNAYGKDRLLAALQNPNNEQMIGELYDLHVDILNELSNSARMKRAEEQSKQNDANVAYTNWMIEMSQWEASGRVGNPPIEPIQAAVPYEPEVVMENLVADSMRIEEQAAQQIINDTNELNTKWETDMNQWEAGNRVETPPIEPILPAGFPPIPIPENDSELRMESSKIGPIAMDNTDEQEPYTEVHHEEKEVKYSDLSVEQKLAFLNQIQVFENQDGLHGSIYSNTMNVANLCSVDPHEALNFTIKLASFIRLTPNDDATALTVTSYIGIDSEGKLIKGAMGPDCDKDEIGMLSGIASSLPESDKMTLEMISQCVNQYRNSNVDSANMSEPTVIPRAL